MAEQWPLTLQDFLNEANFSHGLGSIALQTDMDVGPAKKRARFTKSVDTFSCTITIDRDLYQTFYDFFYVTLVGGVKRFEFNHPITGDLKEFRMSEPQITPFGGRYFQVAMEWEQMP